MHEESEILKKERRERGKWIAWLPASRVAPLHSVGVSRQPFAGVEESPSGGGESVEGERELRGFATANGGKKSERPRDPVGGFSCSLLCSLFV